MCGVKIANRFGRPFPHSMERVELKDFEAGDHIVVERHYTYWHHMIVDKEEDVYIIHFHRSTGPSGSGSGICRNLFDTNDNDTYYRIIYKDEECLPPEKVVETAKKMMNEVGHSYNFVFNNCEHFANLCKTGKSICHQMWTLIEIFGKCSFSSILSFVVQTHRSRRSSKMHPNAEPDPKDIAKCKKVFAELGAKFHPRLAPYFELIGEIFLFFLWDRDAGKAKYGKVFVEYAVQLDTYLATIKELIDKIFLGRRDCDAAKANYRKVFAEYGTQFHTRWATFFASIVEICLLYRDYAAAKAKYNEGEKFTEVIKVITKRVCAAVGSIVGDFIGFYLGNFLCSFLVATLGGGCLLPALGTIALGCARDYLAKLVFAQLGELLEPLVTEYVLRQRKSQ